MPRIGIAGAERAVRHLEFDRRQFLQAEPAAVRFWIGGHGGGALFLVVGIHGARDVRSFQFAASDRSHHIFDRRTRQTRQRAREILVRVSDLRALEQTLDNPAAEPRILCAHGDARCPPDRGTCLAGDNNGFPGGWRRLLRFRGQNLDLVAIHELGRQRRDLAVDLAADGSVSDIGMHRIGKINRRRLAWQRDQLALRRKAEDLVMKKFELGMLEELFRI